MADFFSICRWRAAEICWGCGNLTNGIERRIVAAASLLKSLYLAYFSKPVYERPLYRAVRRRPLHKIVELGLGTGRRASRLIELTQRGAGADRVGYTGVDLFEMRPTGAAGGLTLKEAYRQLRPSGAKVSLLPGDPFSTLSRGANNLLGTDLLIVSADQQGESLERAWFYVPRMLHANSLIFLEVPAKSADTQPSFRQMTLEEINTLAHAKDRRRAA